MSTKELNRLTIIQKTIDKQLTQLIAAQHLNLTVRQIKRLVKKYKQDGPQGLISRKRGCEGNRSHSDIKIALAKQLIEEYYYDFGPKFAAEKLYEKHGIKVNKETLRQWMIEWGLWKAKRQKQAQIHPQRERRECYGELVQIDGSPHAWFEDRGPTCCLLVSIDDATSSLCGLHFEPTETTAGYFKLMRKHINEHGIPLATYNDRHGIFRVNIPTAPEDAETQFGRAMRELGVEVICAYSAEAKGRVERVNQTLQDRLIKEMRLLGISDIESANAYLPTYIKDHNNRFAVEAKSKKNAHRREVPTNNILDLIFSFQNTRKLTKNLELSYENTIYQIKTKATGYRLQHALVTVCEALDGTITIIRQGNILEYTRHVRVQRKPEIIDSKQIISKIDKIRHTGQHKPSANHPWRQYVINPAKMETNRI